MNVLVFNLCMAASLCAVAGGAWAQWGAGVGAMVAGSLLGAYTLAGAFFGGLRPRDGGPS